MKIFIAGPRSVKNLNKKVKERLEKIKSSNFTVLVGDASGVDKEIQTFFHTNRYANVKVFAANGKARNNVGYWDVKKIMVEPGVKGFNFYATKDLAMAKEADYGFMIWNGKSKGTFNNIINLIKLNKKVLVYLTSSRQFYTVNSMEDLGELRVNSSQQKKQTQNTPENSNEKQLSLFI